MAFSVSLVCILKKKSVLSLEDLNEYSSKGIKEYQNVI
jgi:hypothetical protein